MLICKHDSQKKKTLQKYLSLFPNFTKNISVKHSLIKEDYSTILNNYFMKNKL